MSKNSGSSSSGIGFSGLLTVVFITLKLIGKIDWSWWWVLSPCWLPVAVILSGFVIYLIISTVSEKVETERRWRKFKKELNDIKND